MKRIVASSLAVSLVASLIGACGGDAGEAGAAGAAGVMGAEGASASAPTLQPEPVGANCAHGGIRIVGAGAPQYVCNGAPGAEGPPDRTCEGGALIGGVCVLKFSRELVNDWNTSATTCAALGGDLCSASQYSAIATFGPLFTDGAFWTRNFSDNDGGRLSSWLGSSDDPSAAQMYGYACCKRVTPELVLRRAERVLAQGSTSMGVAITTLNPASTQNYRTAANLCSLLRSDLCSAAQYVVLNDAGRFPLDPFRATTNMSDNDSGRMLPVLGVGPDNPTVEQVAGWAYACCAFQKPADGSCPEPGNLIGNICVMELHEVADADFFVAARACGRRGADVCSNSQLQILRNNGRFAGVSTWTNEGADNDSSRVGGLLSTQPDDANLVLDRNGYACCL